MKKVAILLLAVFCTITILESCSSKLCPAYGSYPEGRRRRN
ncbi:MULTISPECIES: hypothetical protein [Pedobacter]|uniref:Cyclic lactone autoinducer peptide n=1 Tax=Pedobacter sp. KACC 23697 TaxID=3149230 RepID=A0AAU7K266_9SPHI|nr:MULTISPECIES: hypothetical protein [Pedobacter]